VSAIGAAAPPFAAGMDWGHVGVWPGRPQQSCSDISGAIYPSSVVTKEDQLWLQQRIISHVSAQGRIISLRVSELLAAGVTGNHISWNPFFSRLIMVRGTNRKGEMRNSRELLARCVYLLGCEDVCLVLTNTSHRSFITESLHDFFSVIF